MKLSERSCFLRTLSLGLLLAAALSARADWNPGDPFKMHYPQLPDPLGWDVKVNTANPPPPAAVADDWLCTQSGPVSDLHIWFSMRGEQPPVLSQMAFTIWSDVPAGQGGPFSHPGTLLWNRIFSPSDFTIRPYSTSPQGWYDPNAGAVLPNDHITTWQLNLNITNPFIQQQGTTYWLGVNFEPLWGDVGWKTSTNHWNDDAVWWNNTLQNWSELRDPLTGQSLDMAFVITTPEPTSLALSVLGGGLLLVLSWRRRLA